MKRAVLAFILLVAVAIIVLEVLQPTPSLPALWGAGFAALAAGVELLADRALRRKEARARARRAPARAAVDDWGWSEIEW